MYDLRNGNPLRPTDLRVRTASSGGASGHAASSRGACDLASALQRAGAWVDATLLA